MVALVTVSRATRETIARPYGRATCLPNRHSVRVSAGHEMFRNLPFPFPGDRFPAQLGGVVQRTVLNGEEPAREVVHTTDGDGINDPNEPGASVATHIWHVIELNSSVASLASMRPGQIATRSGPGSRWVIREDEWPEDE